VILESGDRNKELINMMKTEQGKREFKKEREGEGRGGGGWLTEVGCKGESVAVEDGRARKVILRVGEKLGRVGSEIFVQEARAESLLDRGVVLGAGGQCHRAAHNLFIIH